MNNKLLTCKDDFPIFKNSDTVYLDTASTSQKPKVVIDAIANFYQSYNANVHRGMYSWAQEATSQYETARNRVAEHLSTNSKNIIFTRGTTESINFISSAWGEKNIDSNQNIVISEMEHHSNIIPWQILAKKKKIELRYLPITKDGELILDEIDKIIDEKTSMVSIIHQSNVFGTINPIETVISKAHSKGAVVLVDAAQSIAHQNIDVNQIDCDFLVFSAHKMVGPTGIGCLYVKDKIINNLEPYQGGGQMIDQVGPNSSTWNDVPHRFEAGTPNIAGAVGLLSALDYLQNIGFENIKQHNDIVTNYCIKELNKIDGLRIYGHKNKNDYGPVISFNIDKVHSFDIASLLGQQNIFVRSGHHCAQPIMRKLEIDSSNRISLYIYNDFEDIDRLIMSIKKAKKMILD